MAAQTSNLELETKLSWKEPLVERLEWDREKKEREENERERKAHEDQMVASPLYK